MSEEPLNELTTELREQLQIALARNEELENTLVYARECIGYTGINVDKIKAVNLIDKVLNKPNESDNTENGDG